LPALDQLARLSAEVDQAVHFARTILGRDDADDGGEAELEALARRAEADITPHRAMAQAAVALIDDARGEADDLLRLRVEVFGRLQSEMRRGRTNPGTRLAWAMLRMAFDDEDMAIDPGQFRFDSGKARIAFTSGEIPVVMEMGEADYETRIVAVVDGYRYTAGWTFLFHKPLEWMVEMAAAMRLAGVPRQTGQEWEILEGPEGPLALAAANRETTGTGDRQDADRQVFYAGSLRPVTTWPVAEGAREVVAEFRQTAMRLHDRVMADESVPLALRQALKPVLMGTYQQPDPRDYFDSDFCRRLIEADYLETFIRPMPPGIREELDAYREVLGRLEAGYDDFSFTTDEGWTIFAVTRLDADFTGDGRASDQDPETGESRPRYTWRREETDATVFFSPMPSRFVYAFMLAEEYPGRHRIPPTGRPARTEVWHASLGLIASYDDGADRAEGSEELWSAAIARDLGGRHDSASGQPGWNFPLHVLQRDDQGDPVVLATLTGTVKSPDFSAIAEEEERRQAEDDWLDTTAATLATPGELGLIFHQFFRYCSDSPLPEMPNLIGSHYGLSDTHQTVYESLERRWVGRLIGDCDDLAEVFQVLTRRQGKLSHVMQLPGHAACGYAERTEEDTYRFVILQTGPVMQFTAPTLWEAVEMAYRSFDRGEGVTHMTMDAVPLLLRFANEDTRTPFVLSSRIYEDPDYAETMIQVQAFWHEHVYSAAIKTMEALVAEDQEIGNIKELGSLYERVGFYDKSAEMRYRELDMVREQPTAAISTLLEIVQLHVQEKDRDKALAALGEMETIMRDMVDREDLPEFYNAMSFRSFWAVHLSRLGFPARAWDLIKYDVAITKRHMGRISDPILRTLVFMYDRMCAQRDDGEDSDADAAKARLEVRRELEEAFGRGYFKDDDAYNNIIGRYFTLGRFAVSDIGRETGIARLQADGPYATE
ncbi:MAG: hypothetical protein LIP77_11335, partial [Planctomycetes bacterium]|nr:hypothetical protein [Planctomycetota bacterium]